MKITQALNSLRGADSKLIVSDSVIPQGYLLRGGGDEAICFLQPSLRSGYNLILELKADFLNKLIKTLDYDPIDNGLDIICNKQFVQTGRTAIIIGTYKPQIRSSYGI